MRSYRLLIIEDDPSALELFEMLPMISKDQFDIKYAKSLKTALALLNEEHFFDVVILDLNLPDSSGLDTLDKIFAKHSMIPIIVVTGMADKEMSMEAIDRGAEDYLIKTDFDLKTLARTIVYSIKRKKIERLLRQSELRYRQVYNAMIDYAFTVHIENYAVVRSVHHIGCEKFTGYTKEEFDTKPSLWDTIIHPDDRAMVKKQEDDILAGKDVPAIEYRIFRKNGQLRWVRSVVVLFKDDYFRLISYDNLLVDITSLKAEELKLRGELKKSQEISNAIINIAAKMVEIKDPYILGHQKRVADLSRAIAKEMGLEEERVNGVWVAASLHDLGKIFIPTEILNKDGKLTDKEFDIIKTHSQAGHDASKGLGLPLPILDSILHHHEKVNGSGYPSGLKGPDISLEASILCVADVIDAMTSSRSYRPALTIEKALEEIEANRGILYDPTVVDVCLKLFREKCFKLG